MSTIFLSAVHLRLPNLFSVITSANVIAVIAFATITDANIIIIYFTVVIIKCFLIVVAALCNEASG